MLTAGILPMLSVSRFGERFEKYLIYTLANDNGSAPVPNILSHDQVPTTYTRDSTTTKTGTTLTLGPFHSVPPTLGYGDHQVAQQQPFSVHYETKQPVIGVRTLRRSAEVSHWGANLNIQDDIALFNNGPAYVKGCDRWPISSQTEA